MQVLIVLGPYCVVAGMIAVASVIFFYRVRNWVTLLMSFGSLLLFGVQMLGLLRAADVLHLAFAADTNLDTLRVISSVGNCGAALFAFGFLWLAMRVNRGKLATLLHH